MAKKPRDPRQDCFDQIARATGGRVSRKEVEDAFDEILSRADADTSGKPEAVKMAEYAQEIKKQFIEKSAQERRSINDASIMRIKNEAYIKDAIKNKGITLADAMWGRMAGTAKRFVGHRDSWGAELAGQTRELTRGFAGALEEKDLGNVFASKAVEDDTARELYEINRGKKGTPGKTGNAQALEIAKIVHDWQKVAVNKMNQAGAWIKSYLGYITKTSHDPDRIRIAGMEKWRDDIKQWLDLDRTFGKGSDFDTILKELYPKFVAGDHLVFKNPVDDLSDIGSGVDIARKASAHRELHFKDGESWLQYNKEYGNKSTNDMIINSLFNAARTTTLLRNLGHEPRLAFENLMRYGDNLWRTEKEKYQWERNKRWFRAVFDNLDGTAQRPVDRVRAKWLYNYLAIMRLGHLGFMPLTLFGHSFTKALELRYQFADAGIVKRWGQAISGYFPAGKGSEQERILRAISAGADDVIGRSLSQMYGFDQPTGTMSKLEHFFFKYTGASSMTENSRDNAMAVMAKWFGDMHRKPYEEVGESERQIMRAFSIEKPEWDLLNKAEWHDIDGQKILSPDIARAIPDDDVAAYLRAKNPNLVGRDMEVMMRYVTREKEDLAQRISAYFSDRAGHAVHEIGIKERAIMYGQTRPGEGLNTALKLWLQWKQFPLAMMTRTWAREIYGRDKLSKGQVGSIVELAVSATIVGTFANMLTQALQGQDPIKRFNANPVRYLASGFVRAGGGSIYGDFLLGEFSRFGHRFGSEIAGPTFSQIDDLQQIWQDTTQAASGHHGRTAAAGAIGLVRRNTPFLNMIYTRMAFDYLFMYRLQEWLNPGYLHRHEQRMKQQTGTEYWLKPSSMAQ